MAERTAVDYVQKTIGKALNKSLNFNNEDPNIGVVNKWKFLYHNIFGSLDYLHHVAFRLISFYDMSHPLYLSSLSDDINFGYINADITAEGKESHIWPENTEDYNWCPCPNGSNEYPYWDGWPTEDGSLSAYPIYESNRIIVFLKGLYLKVDASSIVTYDKTFVYDITDQKEQSLRPSDYYDLRVYRFTSATYNTDQGKWIPSGGVTELPRKISGTDMIIKVGTSSSHDIPDDEPRFFMIYWESPDGYTETSPPDESFVNNDVTSLLTFNNGDTPQYRHLFNTERYDLITHQNNGNKYMKNIYSTRYNLTDGNPEHYDDENPTYYRIPALMGSLDTAYTGSEEPGGALYIPGIGNVWGYGYSLDQGANNPSGETVQGIKICYQASAGEDIDMQVVVGPVASSEFYSLKWEDFEWYPETPSGYDVFAKIIIKRLITNNQSAYRPDTYIEYIEYVKSYGRENIGNINFIKDLSKSIYENSILSDYNFYLISKLFAPLITYTPTTIENVGGLINDASEFFKTVNFRNIFNLYWKIPTQHSDINEDDEIVDNFKDYFISTIIGNYNQLEFCEKSREALSNYMQAQLSTILGNFNMNSTEDNFGINIYDTKKIYTPKQLELYFDANNSCYNYITPENLNYDYTLRFYFKNKQQDRIMKDIYVSASRYYITDEDASTLLTDGLSRASYLWPARLNEKHEWLLYGRTTLIPDAEPGENHFIEMRQFKPDDPNIPTYEEFITEQEAIYADDLNSGDTFRIRRAREAILDAVTDQEYLYGGFDEPDTRSFSNEIYSLDDMIVGITFYNTTGLSKWQTTNKFWGGDPEFFQDYTGEPYIRYGFKINGTWYTQSFTQTTVSTARNIYIEEHPEDVYILKQQTNDSGSGSNAFVLDGNYKQIATTFTSDFISASRVIKNIYLKIRKIGEPTGNLFITLNNTSGTTKKPTDILQVSDTVSIEEIGGDFTWVNFNFIRPIEINDSIERYAIVLTTEDPFGENVQLDSDNRIEWVFADRDDHSYGITSINSTLISSINIGSTSVIVVDGSVFSESNFYIKIEDEVIKVTSRSGNVLSLDTATVDSHLSGTHVYEVTYVPSDSEERFIYSDNDDNIYNWTSPSYSTYDATYKIYRKIDDIGLVENVPISEWGGEDITTTDTTIDAFYIAEQGSSYSIPTSDDNIPFYGYLPGLEPWACFNTANTYDFPSVNYWRAQAGNLVDGYISWKGNRADTPVYLYIYPMAYNNSGVITYIPTNRDMYITAVCEIYDGSDVVINKLVTAGTVTPVLLNENKIVKIKSLYIDTTSYQEEPFYGYMASESFIVRSI